MGNWTRENSRFRGLAGCRTWYFAWSAFNLPVNQIHLTSRAWTYLDLRIVGALLGLRGPKHSKPSINWASYMTSPEMQPQKGLGFIIGFIGFIGYIASYLLFPSQNSKPLTPGH